MRTSTCAPGDRTFQCSRAPGQDGVRGLYSACGRAGAPDARGARDASGKRRFSATARGLRRALARRERDDASMKALVLSAGKGERLMPLTETVPKPIIEVGGRPLIHYPLRMLARAGVTEVAINLYHLAAAVQKALGGGNALGIRITYAPETTLLGTGGPLVGLRQFFGDETFAILNCDTIIDLDLRALEEFHRRRGGLATLVLRESGTPEAYSRIEIDSDAHIRRMRLLKRGLPAEFDDYRPPPAAAGATSYAAY